jgi:hypothetical protein
LGSICKSDSTGGETGVGLVWYSLALPLAEAVSLWILIWPMILAWAFVVAAAKWLSV